MLSSWVDSHAPAHVALYALASDLTPDEAARAARGWLAATERAARDYLAIPRPRCLTDQPGTVTYSSLAQSPAHWVLYGMTAKLGADQARAARREILEIVEHVQGIEPVPKRAGRTTRGRARGGAR